MMMLMLVSSLSLIGLAFAEPGISAVNQERTEERCPPCELFFRKLESTEKHEKLSQVVRVQERGEPKSGTKIMFNWTTGALLATCNYLQRLYGEKSCLVDMSPGPEDDGNSPARNVNLKMIFEPALGIRDGRCPCETIERVSIVVSTADKHGLPVRRRQCAFRHNGSIELAQTERGSDEHKSACKFADGSRVHNNFDLWRCMHEASCDITDDWLQMAIFRDPRPAVVSSYYHLQVHQGRTDLGHLDDFVVRELPILCQWLAIRHILFSGLLAHQSMVFWYSDSMADPLEWFYHWFDSVGLQLPHDVVQGVATAAASNDIGFHKRKVDIHPGEIAGNDTDVRKFEDEVSPEVVKTADAVLRVWLPAVLLEKLGVPPEEEGV